MWTERDKNGSLRLYIEKPVQKQKIKDSEYETCLDWCTDVDKMIGYLPSNLYPELKWEDDPVEVGLYDDTLFKFISELITEYNDNVHLKYDYIKERFLNYISNEQSKSA